MRYIVGCFIIFLLFLYPFVLWTDRSLDFWLTYFKGVETDCPFWLSLIVTIVGNGVVLIGNALSEFARLAL